MALSMIEKMRARAAFQRGMQGGKAAKRAGVNSFFFNKGRAMAANPLYAGRSMEDGFDLAVHDFEEAQAAKLEDMAVEYDEDDAGDDGDDEVEATDALEPDDVADDDDADDDGDDDDFDSFEGTERDDD